MFLNYTERQKITFNMYVGTSGALPHMNDPSGAQCNLLKEWLKTNLHNTKCLI